MYVWTKRATIQEIQTLIFFLVHLICVFIFFFSDVHPTIHRLLHDDLNDKYINGISLDKIESATTNLLQQHHNWWINSRSAQQQKDTLLNADGRYECPRDFCRKTYKEASSLQRHIRCVGFM